MSGDSQMGAIHIHCGLLFFTILFMPLTNFLFLKKLWLCVSWRLKHENLVLLIKLIMVNYHCERFGKVMFRVSALLTLLYISLVISTRDMILYTLKYYCSFLGLVVQNLV